MANIAHPQSSSANASPALIYAPPPSTATHALNASLFAPSSSPHIRFAGNANTRSHASNTSSTPKPVYPERYNQRYTLPSGIEEQPF